MLFQQAYDFFNRALFQDKLPTVLLTAAGSSPETLGYFCPQRFVVYEDDLTLGELALNRGSFAGRTDEEIMSTLVHEMVHVWQEVFGKPGRANDHNRGWAAKMKSIGLYPSDTG